MIEIVILILCGMVALALAGAALRAALSARAHERSQVQLVPAVVRHLADPPAGPDLNASFTTRIAASNGGGKDLYAVLEQRVDLANLRPQLAPWVEVKTFRLRWGNDYALIANMRELIHMQVEPWEADLALRMDGTLTLRDLIVGHLEDGGEFDTDTVAGLVLSLQEADCLVPQTTDAAKALANALRPPPSPSRTITDFMRTLQFNWTGAEALVMGAYKGGMRWFFTKIGFAVAVAVAVGGVVAFFAAEASGRFTFDVITDPVQSLVLIGLGFVLTFFHELGHGLVIVHNGRRVKHAGFMLYYGSPAFFVEATDSLMLDRGPRLMQSAAGPFSEAVIAGVASILVFIFPAGGIAQFLYTFSVLNYFIIVLNLVPLLELDGYWILTDVIQVPDLRPRSLQFVQHDLWHKLRERARFSLQEAGLGLYGILGFLFSALTLLSAGYFWKARFQRFFTVLWDGGLSGRILLVVLILFFTGPVLRGLLAAGGSILRRIRALWRKVKFKLETSWRVEAARLIDELPAFEDLPGALLSDLAGYVELRSYHAGQTIFRQADRGDAFYVVRSGTVRIETENVDTGDVILLNQLHRGESFGELGLLTAAPRAATARAEDEVELFRIDKGTFDRLLADEINAPEFGPTLQSLAELRELGPFRHLSTEELSEVLAHGSWVTASPGDAIIEQGEAGDAFYALGSGQVEYVRDGTVIGTGVAGSFFGELALLRDAPRSASVIARTPVRAFRLDREGFDSIIAEGFSGGRLRPTIDRTS